jgi:putative Holliday junction resolvase
MNILALDFGTKHIGMAWADTKLIGVIVPFGVIEVGGKGTWPKACQELKVLLEREKIDQMIMGLPWGLQGEENNNTMRIREFVKLLQGSTTVPIEFYDERFSSQAADRMEGGVSRDEKSAIVILEGYLVKNKL